MTNILKFQTKEQKAKAGHIGIIAQIRTTMLEDGSIWYRIGTQNLRDKEIIWDEWRRVDET